jgi:hypothetical protein
MPRTFGVLILTAALATPAVAATRLTYMIGGSPTEVAWAASSFPLAYLVDRRVANSFPGGMTMVDRAFTAWTTGDMEISFRSAGVVDGAVAGQDGRNTITIADDLFGDQIFVAVTTNWYDGSGRLTEADIQIDPQMIKSEYNMQHALTHEVGHFLGLDHSAVLSAVMYPFVGLGTGAPALDSDDKIGITAAYAADPSGIGATLSGRVVGDSGGIFAAQVVALNDRGEPVATALTNSSGDFVLQGIPAGNYRLYAEPLDGPVDVRNLAGVWREAKTESFRTQFMSEEVRLESGRFYGNLIVNGGGALVKLNPKWIGIASVGTREPNLSSTAVAVQAGQTVTLAVAGDGFTSGMTTFEVLSPAFRRTSDFSYGQNWVSAIYTIAPDIRSGSAVVFVTSGQESAALTGALRVSGAPVRVRTARH